MAGYCMLLQAFTPLLPLPSCCRCGQVWYCTPACAMSDWERHELKCT